MGCEYECDAEEVDTSIAEMEGLSARCDRQLDKWVWFDGEACRLLGAGGDQTPGEYIDRNGKKARKIIHNVYIDGFGLFDTPEEAIDEAVMFNPDKPAELMARVVEANEAWHREVHIRCFGVEPPPRPREPVESPPVRTQTQPRLESQLTLF